MTSSMPSLLKLLDFYRRLFERRLTNAFAELAGPGERYRLLSQLGRGGMGEVWLGVDRKLGRRVAVKLARAATPMDAASATRFEREIRATIELSHPHTVRLFDHGVTADGTRYYVMELLEGKNLSELVAEQGPLSPTRAIELVRQASSALAEAHAAGIVHRDVKPQNFVVVEANGRRDFLKVLDFGLAIGAEDPSLTGDGVAAGSPSYVSPEVILGEVADARSDIYGLGCVLYTLLTGRPPFVMESTREVLMAHLHRDPDAPSMHTAHAVPAELDALVLRCLAKDPGRRPRDGAALFDELVGLLRVHASRVFRGDNAKAVHPAPREVPVSVRHAAARPSKHRSGIRLGRTMPDVPPLRRQRPSLPLAMRIQHTIPDFSIRDEASGIDGEDLPTLLRPSAHERVYEANLERTRDVRIAPEFSPKIAADWIEESALDFDPDDCETFDERRRPVVDVFAA